MAETAKRAWLPHIGEAKVSLLTVGSIIWSRENTSKVPHKFLAAYLEKFGTKSDESPVNCDNLSEEQLNEIAVILGQEIKNRPSPIEDMGVILNAENFKVAIESKAAEMEKRSSEIMKDMFSATKIGRLENMVGLSQNRGDRLFKTIDPFGIKALQDSLNPHWLKTMRDTMSVGQTVRDSLRLMPDLKGLGIGIGLANNLAIPSTEFALLSERISEEFRISNHAIRAIADARRAGKFSETYLQNSLKLPGFNTTVRAGLAGLSNKSVTADILANYGDLDLSSSAPLGVALNAIRHLDVIEPDDFDEVKEISADTRQSMTAIKSHHILIMIGVVQTIIAVLMLYISLSDESAETHETVLKEITELHETMTKEFNRENGHFSYDRIVTGHFHLREDGNVEATSIMLLNPGRVVREKSVKDAWAYVEVLPYGDEDNIFGWVYRGGLRNLP